MEALLHGPLEFPWPPNAWPSAYPRNYYADGPTSTPRTQRRRRERANRRRRGGSLSEILPLGRRRRAEQRCRQAFRPAQPVLHRRPRVPMVHLELRTHHQQCAGPGRALKQALANYEDTVLKAAREAEDALIGFLKAQESAVSSQKSVQAALNAVKLSLISTRRRHDYQRVVDSQRSLLQEENKLAERALPSPPI